MEEVCMVRDRSDAEPPQWAEALLRLLLSFGTCSIRSFQ
jgi:hypothetical protein